MSDEYTENVMKGLRWIPIYHKAMEIHEELEKRNTTDMAYHNSLGDVLYLGLGMLQMMIDDEPKKSLDKLIGTFREEYISSQEANLRFMRVFGQMESESEDKIRKLRQNKNRMEYEIDQLKIKLEDYEDD